MILYWGGIVQGWYYTKVVLYMVLYRGRIVHGWYYAVVVLYMRGIVQGRYCT